MSSNEAGFSPENILACVSEGTFSDHAIHAAADLANQFGAKLELLHVVQEPNLLTTKFDSNQVAEMQADQVDRARKTIAALASSSSTKSGGHSSSARLLVTTIAPRS